MNLKPIILASVFVLPLLGQSGSTTGKAIVPNGAGDKDVQSVPAPWLQSNFASSSSTLTVTSDFKEKVSVESKSGFRVDRMTDEEYAKLQAARKALADTEAAIEKAHGAYTRAGCSGWCATTGMPERGSDTVEIRGQFLIIQSAEGGKP